MIHSLAEEEHALKTGKRDRKNRHNACDFCDVADAHEGQDPLIFVVDHIDPEEQYGCE